MNQTSHLLKKMRMFRLWQLIRMWKVKQTTAVATHLNSVLLKDHAQMEVMLVQLKDPSKVDCAANRFSVLLAIIFSVRM